ncbi:MAG TPA: energy-coupling factor transporter transmembrane component T [Rectinemataceae bacterium]|nr:energy-coupling factor transporter transmembrane component T [Rectinemataceae bacterium]
MAGIRNRSGDGADGRGPAVHPALRLVSSFLLILLVSLSRSLYFLLIVGTYELVLIALLSGPRIVRVLKTSIVAALFTLVIFLPSALWGNWPGVLAVAAKVLLSVAAAALVSVSSGWTAISRALSSLRVPDTFILVLDLAIKYISLLGGLVLDMLYALKLRSVGRNRDKTTSLSGVAGTVFLKSKEAAEEMYAAMECRGFTGTYRVAARRGLFLRDYAFVLVTALIAAAFFLVGGAE